MIKDSMKSCSGEERYKKLIEEQKVNDLLIIDFGVCRWIRILKSREQKNCR
jgi:hypothetical protein